MNPTLAVFVLLYSALLAAWALITALLGRGPGLGLIGGLVLLELTVIAQAALESIGLLVGRRASESVTHVGYLVTSVVLLPLLLAITRPARVPAAGTARVGAQHGWDAAIIAVACIALAVVDLRLVTTGGTGLR
ncbi:MAG: hypothetical protein ACR2GH_17325 [Pseudonocardia sp.]